MLFYGDIIFCTDPGASVPHHVAIYLGGDRILQAPETGQDVGYGTLSMFTGQTATVRRAHRGMAAPFRERPDDRRRLLAARQQRGEIRSDYPARALAAVLLQAWAMSLNREGAVGRPPGDREGPSRSWGDLAVEVCFAGMHPMLDEDNVERPSEPTEE